MGTLTGNGFKTRTFEDYKNELKQVFIDAFGADLVLDDDTPQGVIINRVAQLAYNCDMDGLNAYLQYNINTATGVCLDFLAFLKGTKRKSGTNQQITCSFQGTYLPISIPEGTIFTVINTNYQYKTTSAVTMSVSPTTVTLQSVEVGDYPVNDGDKLQSNIYIKGLTDIEITTVIAGTNVESDGELRIRLQSISENFIDTTGATMSALLSISEVTKVNFLQHEDDVTVPEGTTEFLVVGGDENEIAATILKYKCATSETYGTTTVTVPNYYGRTRTIKFTRPDDVEVVVSILRSSKEGQVSINATYDSQIISEILEYINRLPIGIDVSYTTIYGIIAKYNAFDIYSLEIGVKGGTSASENLAIEARKYATIDSEDITFGLH